MGRPSKYSEKIAEKICEEIATSSNGLHKIAKRQGVTIRSVMRWLEEHEAFRHNYIRAREIQGDLMASKVIEAAEKCRNGKKTKVSETKDGTFIETTIGDMVERSRLQVDAYKWLASKLAPKKYGDKLDVTSGGEKIAQAPCIINWSKPAEEIINENADISPDPKTD